MKILQKLRNWKRLAIDDDPIFRKINEIIIKSDKLSDEELENEMNILFEMSHTDEMFFLLEKSSTSKNFR